MIIDRVENAHLYLGIHPTLDAALDYIQNHKIQVGEKIKLCDGAVGGGAMAYMTKPLSECRAESHVKDLDIHLSLKGYEVVGYCPVSYGIPADNTQEDAPTIYYKDAPLEYCTLKPGMFCVAFPQDIHSTKGMSGAPELAEKVIMKIKL